MGSCWRNSLNTSDQQRRGRWHLQRRFRNLHEHLKFIALYHMNSNISNGSKVFENLFINLSYTLLRKFPEQCIINLYILHSNLIPWVTFAFRPPFFTVRGVPPCWLPFSPSTINTIIKQRWTGRESGSLIHYEEELQVPSDFTICRQFQTDICTLSKHFITPIRKYMVLFYVWNGKRLKALARSCD